MEWSWAFSSIVLLAWVALGIRALPGLLRCVSLTIPHDGQKTPDVSYPEGLTRVSVILSARNEADHIEHTLASLRSQTWPNMDVIVVNDRSADDTGVILDNIAHCWPELRVLHVTDLPHGWLGKNYALHTASKLATGDWLLFTDADVRFHPDAVRTAVCYAEKRGVHHLTLSPRLVGGGFWLRSAVYLFMYNVILVFCPQDADNPKSSASVGIGAFNMVRKSVYEHVGGHHSVAMRPDEDLALGHIIKQSGYKQLFSGGANLLQVKWYSTLAEMAHGLEKNALAPFQYRLWKFSVGVLLLLLVYDGPVIGIVATSGWPMVLSSAAFAAEIYLFHKTRRYSGLSTWWALAIPLAAPILFFMLIRSAALTLFRGGIMWRGTFYSLRELRKSALTRRRDDSHR